MAPLRLLGIGRRDDLPAVQAGLAHGIHQLMGGCGLDRGARLRAAGLQMQHPAPQGHHQQHQGDLDEKRQTQPGRLARFGSEVGEQGVGGHGTALLRGQYATDCVDPAGPTQALDRALRAIAPRAKLQEADKPPGVACRHHLSRWCPLSSALHRR